MAAASNCEQISLQRVNRIIRHLLAQQILADSGLGTQQIASTRVPISPYVCMVNLGALNTSGHETQQECTCTGEITKSVSFKPRSQNSPKWTEPSLQDRSLGPMNCYESP